ncbi:MULTISPECIES: ABC transporter substrate-binding protein [unclassified Deinococcus]|jgi:NitT/TauT family transport system substrate-binding protein|uniref:ABC transporter substrate-binding protein n=1 Tax=unclassified Deinococcus TaxID=2623546 RepID=UPI000C19B8BD|nr:MULTISPECIES: ABC transporter substrate-binding protein [unclassified Deinococcus]MCD0168843.1 ABC transporter substrate-binding protein [Deinococcus sp. 23YEL01]PIG98523.1 taurine ABC transporter permease [Deinococcus sp. UR1]
MTRKILTATLALTLSSVAAAQSTNVRFTLDWAFEGPGSPYLLAADRGYFAKQGLNVTIDRGFGSGDAVTKIASGTYDMGFGDINAMMEFNARNPAQRLVAVYMVYNAPPHSILVLKSSGIKTPKDMEGRTLAAPVGDASRRLFPAFAEANGIDASKVKWVSVDGGLREPMLARKQTDGIAGFTFTSLLSLGQLGVKADEVTVFPYAQSISGLYGNAIIVRADWAKKNPQVVKGMLVAINQGLKDAIKDPAAAIASLQKKNALINPALETERLKLALSGSVLTKDTRALGLGLVRPDRLKSSITVVQNAFDLPRGLTPTNVFDTSYLPPAADRKVK